MAHPSPAPAQLPAVHTSPAAPAVPTLLGADLSSLVHTPAAREAAATLFAALAASKAPNTRRAYETGWMAWAAWAESAGVCPLPAPPAAVAAFLARAAADPVRPMALSTLRVWLAAIGHVHQHRGHPAPGVEPIVRAALAGIRRNAAAQEAPAGAGRRRAEEAAPLTAPRLRAALEGFAAAKDRQAVRDRALLLLCYAGGLRRSEAARLRWGRVTLDDHGVLLRLGATKTDQTPTGRGARVALPRRALGALTCPAAALEAWARTLATAPRGDMLAADAPVFPYLPPRGGWPAAGEPLRQLSGAAIDGVVRRRAVGVAGGPFSGHSPRAGLATTMAAAGVPIERIATALRHRKLDTTRRYVRDRDAWAGVDGDAMGL